MNWSIVNWLIRYEKCFIYEIYPQSETPHLTQIAQLNFDPFEDYPALLLPGTVIWYNVYDDRMVFRVWDYRLDHSICFSVESDLPGFKFDLEVYFILSKAKKKASNSFVGR